MKSNVVQAVLLSGNEIKCCTSSFVVKSSCVFRSFLYIFEDYLSSCWIKAPCLRRQEGLDDAEASLHKLPCHLLRVETHILCMKKKKKKKKQEEDDYDDDDDDDM